MISATTVLAFSAGMLATFNPCGFSLLPAYVGAFVSSNNPTDRLDVRIRRAVGAAAAMSVAFVSVFTIVGVVVGTLADQVRRQLPWITIAVGVVLVLAGLAMVAGWKPTVAVPMLQLRRRGGKTLGMMIYGATFAVASLSCTIGPFMAVTGTVLDRSVGEIVGTYVAYGLGMGFMILAISVAVAFAHTSVVNRMRSLGAHVSRIGGSLMILAGVYVIWYARWELAVFAGNPEVTGLIEVGERIRAVLVGFIQAAGPGRIGLVTLAVVGGAMVVARSQHRARTEELTTDSTTVTESEAAQ